MIRLIVGTVVFFCVAVFFVCVAAVVIAVLPDLPASTSINALGEEAVSPEADAARIETAEARASATTLAGTRTATTPSDLASVPPIPGASPVPPEAGPPAGGAYVVAESAAVYSKNSTSGEVLRRLQEGEQIDSGVRVLDADGLWVEVRLNDRTLGFMRSEDLVLN